MGAFFVFYKTLSFLFILSFVCLFGSAEQETINKEQPYSIIEADDKTFGQENVSLEDQLVDESSFIDDEISRIILSDSNDPIFFSKNLEYFLNQVCSKKEEKSLQHIFFTKIYSLFLEAGKSKDADSIVKMRQKLNLIFKLYFATHSKLDDFVSSFLFDKCLNLENDFLHKCVLLLTFGLWCGFKSNEKYFLESKNNFVNLMFVFFSFNDELKEYKRILEVLEKYKNIPKEVI